MNKTKWDESGGWGGRTRKDGYRRNPATRFISDGDLQVRANPLIMMSPFHPTADHAADGAGDRMAALPSPRRRTRCGTRSG